ncbi:hypothetical protein [Pseudonocardia sp.]|uniref:hypothetical protein n=1 Tax=Pseudonocardia sp. TaxID=60912 RepID=UPI0031FE374D
MIRIGHTVLTAVTALAVFAACGQGASGSSGPSAQEVVDNLNPLFPVGNQRDNTESCTSAGCSQLITTDAVSVYRMRDESTAANFADGLGDAVEQIGPFVLSYSGSEQQLTPSEMRAAYARQVRALVGG